MATDAFGNPADLAARMPGRRSEQVVEVLVFLLLIIPSMFIGLIYPNVGRIPFSLLALGTIARDLALVGLVIFFLWRNGERDESIGWTLRHAPENAALGLLLFFPVTLAAATLDTLLRGLGLSGPSPDTMPELLPRGPAEIVLAVMLVIIVAIAEETIFRGYLIMRLSNITGLAYLAVLLSSLIFAVGHGYQGTAGVITIGFIGVSTVSSFSGGAVWSPRSSCTSCKIC